MNSGSLSRITWEKSRLLAVVPPIDTRAPVAFSIGGSVSSRASRTVWSVRSSCGVVVG